MGYQQVNSTLVKMKFIKILFLCLLITLMVHCKMENHDYNKYLGTWTAEHNGSEWIIEILKDGSNYTFNGHLDGFLGDYKSGLISQQGQLVVKGVPTMGEVPITVSSAGKTILFSGTEFKLVRRSTSIPYGEFIENMSSTLSKHHFEEFNCNQSGNCECKSQYAYRDIKITQAELDRCKQFYREQDEKHPGWRDTKLLTVEVSRPLEIFEGNDMVAVVSVTHNTFQGISQKKASYAQISMAVSNDEGLTWKFFGLGDIRDNAQIKSLKSDLPKFSDAIGAGVEHARKQFDEQYGIQKWDQ